VTGASSGIGAAIAKQLASEGYALWLTYNSQDRAVLEVAEACREIGAAEVHHSPQDLRDSSSIAGFAAAVKETWGACHVLINNGGICPYQAYEDITEDDWDLVLETNARGSFVLTRHIIPLLQASAGDKSIVNISSLAAQVGGITAPIHYAASKAALLAISKSFARQLAPDKIRVNSVAWIVSALASDRAGFVTGATYDINGGVRIG